MDATFRLLGRPPGTVVPEGLMF